MDSTLFDYKTGMGGQSGSGQKSNLKSQQRPISAQNYKVLSNTMSPNYGASQQDNTMPPLQGGGRVRPTTAINRQGMVPSSDMNKNFAGEIIEELEPEEEARLVERAAYAEPIQLQDVQKLMPRNIKVEKERLYEDTLHLKQHINTLKEENIKLKTKNLNLERENVKLVKMMEKVGSKTAEYGKPVESSLVVALKKQVKEQKEELNHRIEELETMKRNTKFTKFQELEIELKAYTDENIRLRQMFEELMRSKPQIKPEDYNALEERYYMQTNLIETLQRDHARLGEELKYMEQQNYNMQVAQEIESKNADKQKSELIRLRKQLKEKDLKAVPTGYKQDFAGPKVATLGSGEKNKEDSNVKELRKRLDQQEQTISQRDKTIDDLRKKLNEKLGSEGKDKHSQNQELLELREQYAELESKYRAMLNMNYSADDRKKNNDSRPSAKYDEDLPTDPRTTDKSYDKGKKVNRVTFDDVKDLGYELSLKLRLRSVPLDELLKSFERYGNRISINDMRNILAHDPFGVKDESNALLIARYLIEPSNENQVALDNNRTQDVAVIKNSFKKLVGSYSLLDEDEEKIISDDLGETLAKFEQALQQQFMKMPEGKTGYLSAEQISKAFDALDIEIDKRDFEYLIMSLYEYTGNLKRLDFMKMFEIFDTEERKRLNKIMNMYQGGQNEEDSERSDRKVKFRDQNEPQAKGKNQAPVKKTDEEEEEEEYAEDEENYEDEEYAQDDDEYQD